METTKISWTDATFNPAVDGREVPGFPAYRVTPDGRVWSSWGRGGRVRRIGTAFHIKAPLRDKGHHRVELRAESGEIRRFMVHRLVLTLFVGPCPEGMEGCHNDGNHANNSVDNLRWDTPQANWADRKRHGRGVEGEKNSCAKLNVAAVIEIRAARLQGVSLKALSEQFGVSMTKISHVASGKSWKHVREFPIY